MNPDKVKIKQERIDHHQEKVNQYLEHHTNRSRAIPLVIIVVQLEQITIIKILSNQIHNSYQQRIQQSHDAIPREDLTQHSWDLCATPTLHLNPRDNHHNEEYETVHQGAHHHNHHLVDDSPGGILQVH